MARGVESRLGVVVNSVTSLFSAVIPSQALAALMIPVTSRLSARTGVPMSRLLLPMAFCILTATNTTLIANSPLIVLNDLIASANSNLPPGAHTIPKFGLFSVTPVGLVLAVVGVLFFYLFTRKLLPEREDDRLKVTPGRTESYFADTYGIAGETAELTVTAESPLVGMSIGEVEQLHGGWARCSACWPRATPSMPSPTTSCAACPCACASSASSSTRRAPAFPRQSCHPVRASSSRPWASYGCASASASPF
jgi:di/tricarboxylate transporter